MSVLIEVPENEKSVLNDLGIGIDLGVKNFAVCSDGKIYKNINKSSRIQKLESYSTKYPQTKAESTETSS